MAPEGQIWQSRKKKVWRKMSEDRQEVQDELLGGDKEKPSSPSAACALAKIQLDFASWTFLWFAFVNQFVCVNDLHVF